MPAQASHEPITIGMDLGDLDQPGEVAGESSVATAMKGMAEKFAGVDRCRIAMEVGAHSPWVSRWLTARS